VDEVGPRHRDAYGEWLQALAERESDGRSARNRRQRKARRLAAERVPLEVYEARELAEMSRDMYADRSGFARARHDFVRKIRPAETPARLRFGGTSPRPRTTVLRPAVPVSA